MKLLDVSVIIPCYNAAETLRRSLDSAANQVALPREIIVVDDGSDVPIAPLVDIWAREIQVPVRVLTQKNLGAPSARNAGVRIAQGRYISFLDADDIWLPDKLRIQCSVMDREGLTLSAHGYNYNADQTSKLPSVIDAERVCAKKLSKWRFAYGNPFFTPTVMVSKDEFLGFDERFRSVDDYKAWFESFLPGRCGYIDIVMASGFKPPIGHSGLSGSIDRMHKSYVEVLKTLLRERRINFFFYAVARLIESIKLPVRRQITNGNLD